LHSEEKFTPPQYQEIIKTLLKQHPELALDGMGILNGINIIKHSRSNKIMLLSEQYVHIFNLCHGFFQFIRQFRPEPEHYGEIYNALKKYTRLKDDDLEPGIILSAALYNEFSVEIKTKKSDMGLYYMIYPPGYADDKQPPV
jgi:hypothetical protein